MNIKFLLCLGLFMVVNVFMLIPAYSDYTKQGLQDNFANALFWCTEFFGGVFVVEAFFSDPERVNLAIARSQLPDKDKWNLLDVTFFGRFGHMIHLIDEHTSDIAYVHMVDGDVVWRHRVIKES